MIGKLLALLGTKQGVLAVLVTMTVVLGAGFGFLAPTGTDASGDGPTNSLETPSPERTSTPSESPPADGGGSGDDSEDASTASPPSSSTATPAEGENDGNDENADRGDDAGADDADRGSTNDDGNSAETLDLRLGLQDGRALVDVDAAVPGQSGASTVSVRNAGSLDGRLSASVSIVEQHENGLTEPEREVDDSPERGELGEWMKFRVSLPNGDGDGRTYLIGSADDYVSPTRVDDEPTTTAALASREQRDLLVEWCITDDAGNEIQSDSVRLAFEFSLVQS